MMDEFDKCRVCRWYDNFDGCTAFMCNNKNEYEPNKERIIEKQKKKEFLFPI